MYAFINKIDGQKHQTWLLSWRLPVALWSSIRHPTIEKKSMGGDDPLGKMWQNDQGMYNLWLMMINFFMTGKILDGQLWAINMDYYIMIIIWINMKGNHPQ